MDNGLKTFWEATYKQNIAKLIGVCCRYTQDRAAAEDLAHDAFLIAIAKVSTFENKGPFDAWLRRIVVNVSLQYLRNRKNYQESAELYIYHAVSNDSYEELVDNERLDFSEAELLEAISHLPEHHRLVFNMYVVDNFTHAQIAAQLCISEGTSKSHLARARKKIRELLTTQFRKRKKQNRTLMLLLVPSKFWNIDQLTAGKLNRLELEPQKKYNLNHLVQAPMPPLSTYSQVGLSAATYLKTGLMALTTMFIMSGAPNSASVTQSKDTYAEKSEIIAEKPQALAVDVIPETVVDSGLKNKSNAFAKIPDRTTATISEIPVIEKTNILKQMKNLKTIGGLLLASLTIDSLALSKTLPVPVKNPEATETGGAELREQESIKSVTKRNGQAVKGTFSASKLLWSESHELFLLGERITVNMNTQKFIASGKASFLDKFGYLVLNGAPINSNETIELTTKKYRLVELLPAKAIEKYGDNGRNGVVEITEED